MALLTECDYMELERMQLDVLEDEPKRFLIFKNFQLKPGLYQVESCDVIVVIPSSYPQAGNDMFWTYPRLLRSDNAVIPGTLDLGHSQYLVHMQTFDGKVFDRWSRHWQVGNQIWRPGRDDVRTIINRLTYVLANSLEG